MPSLSSISVICLYFLLGQVICQSFNPTPRNQRTRTSSRVAMPRTLGSNAVADAFEAAGQNIRTLRQRIASRRRRPLDPRRNIASSRHNFFQRSKPRSNVLQSTQEVFEEATRILMNDFNLSPEQVRSGLGAMNLLNILRDNSVEQCQNLFNFTCRTNDRYRSYDGTCNNLQHPSWGMASSCFERLADAHYSDGVSAIRLAVSGRPLPSPRTISLEIHNHLDNPTDYVTHMFMQWGQFLDHDISLTPISTGVNGEPLECCPESDDDPPQCDPILLEGDDPFYSALGIDCLNNARSTICSTCTMGPRQQTDQLTSFIDASHIYGTSRNESRGLRTLDGTGRLRSFNDRNSGELLPESTDPQDGCSFQETTQNCFLGGDPRVNQHPALTSFHTVFLREHNRIAGRLRALNSRWDDDRIFEETRRIVGAEMQMITYNEFLPLVIGPERMQWFDLNVQPRMGYTAYDPTVQPTLVNEFSTAAFRFGHSMINSNFLEIEAGTNRDTTNRLRDIFLYPFGLYSGELDRIMRGMTRSPSQKFDRWMVRDVTNHLYQMRGNQSGLDLASLNIKRGRDHGIPPYTEMVRFCGGPDIRSFRDLDRLFQRGYRQVFQNVYESVDDIDFFSGGLAERPNQGAVIGPTFTCVVGIQFYHLKYGDRFYFEHGGQTGSFSLEQLQQLKRISFGKIICENTEINDIQSDVMLYPSNRNRVRRCEDIPDIDLRYWRD